MLIDRTEGYLDEVKEFARTHGLIGDLEDQLKRWEEYADLDDNGKRNLPARTKVELFKDFAPQSFRFCVYHRKSKEKYQEDFNANYDKVKARYPDCTPEQWRMWAKDDTPEWDFWFNGGLIFHGSHDNGGDGGAPTFCVNNGSKRQGWSSHT